MQKKILVFLMSGCLLLTSCGGDSSIDNESESASEASEVVVEKNNSKENETKSPDESNDETLDEGQSTETEYGKMARIAGPFEINEQQETGPFNITLEKGQVGLLEPAEGYKDLFDGSDKVSIISFQISVTNNSADTNSFYPDQGILVTDTGKQVDAHMIFSDSVGGDFHGEVTKDGEVWFLFDGEPTEIKSVRYIVSAPHDSNLNSIGEEIEFSIDIK